MRGRLFTALTAVAVFGLGLPGSARAQDLKPGEYRVITKDKGANGYKGGYWEAFKWDAVTFNNGSPYVMTWAEAQPDEFGNKPVKYILYFGNGNGGKLRAAADTEKLMTCSNTDLEQFDFYIECAPDVRCLLEMNRSRGKGGMCWIRVAVEYSNGKRSWFYKYDSDPIPDPFNAKGWPCVVRYDAAMKDKLPKNCIRIPEAWKFSSGPAVAETAKGADTPAATGDLKPGEFRVIKKDKGSNGYSKGYWEAFKWDAVTFNNGSPIVITWAEATPDKFGNKPVKYILYFGSGNGGKLREAGDTEKLMTASNKDIGQWEYYIECAPDVRQFVDINDKRPGTGNMAWVRVAVEYANGKRSWFYKYDSDPIPDPFAAKGWPCAVKYDEAKMASKLAKTCIRVPEDWNWK